jgi:hypothetical protein
VRSTEDCIARVAAKGTISQQEAAQILEDVAARAEKMRATGVADPVVAAAGEAAMGIKEKAKADFLRAVKNADALAQTMSRAKAVSTEVAPVRGRVGRIVQGATGASPRLGLADGYRSQMHYVNGASQHDSVEGMWGELARRVLASMGNRLRRDGNLKAAIAMRGTELEHEVAEHMWRSNPEAVPNTAQPVSKLAQQIGDAFFGPLKLLHTRLNAELPTPIGTASDRVARTNWDPRQLRLAAGHGATVDQAFEAWRARDEPRMFPASDKDYEPEEGETEAAARTRFLRSLWEATTSGVRLGRAGLSGMAEDEDAFVPASHVGTGDIARRLTQPRVVHWNSARDWLDHMREFGGGDGLAAQVSRTINTESRQLALLHYFGTNPAATLNKAIERSEKEIRRSGDLDALARFQQQIPNLKNTMGRLTGQLNMPVNQDRAEAFENLMTLEAAAHLGGLSATHGFAAPMTFGGELKLHGVPYMESIPAVIKALVTGRGGQAEQEALADAGAYVHGYANAIARSQGAFDHGIPGFVSFMAGHFMRMTGITAMMDRFQGKAVKGVLMDRLGRATAATLDQMEPHQQIALRSYGIGDQEWELLRNAADPAIVNGKRWVTPHDAIATNPDDVAGMLLRQGVIKPDTPPEAITKAVQLKQWEMADQLGMYLNDAADHGAVRPGVRERAMVLGDLRPGDKNYMLWRALAQFKMWPLAALSQRLGAAIVRSLSNKEMASNIGLMFALATAGGALRMAANDAASGNAQRNYLSSQTLLAAFAQGGGLGIWGDFLFGEVNRLGVGAIATGAGPIVGDVDRLATMVNDFRVELFSSHPERAITHAIPQIMRFAIGHIPFANLIYLKGALDYLAWYHIYNAISPGWWERTNRRIARENGRTMMGYVPGGGVPGGIPGVYGSGWGRLLPGTQQATQ